LVRARPSGEAQPGERDRDGANLLQASLAGRGHKLNDENPAKRERSYALLLLSGFAGSPGQSVANVPPIRVTA